MQGFPSEESTLQPNGSQEWLFISSPIVRKESLFCCFFPSLGICHLFHSSEIVHPLLIPPPQKTTLRCLDSSSLTPWLRGNQEGRGANLFIHWLALGKRVPRLKFWLGNFCWLQIQGRKTVRVLFFFTPKEPHSAIVEDTPHQRVNNARKGGHKRPRRRRSLPFGVQSEGSQEESGLWLLQRKEGKKKN